MSKYFAYIMTCTVMFICVCAVDSSAQVGRRRVGISEEMRVPLPLPEPEDAVEIRSADEGKVFECVEGRETAAREEASRGVADDADREEIFAPQDVTTKAVIKSKTPPTYTEEARWNGTRGRVILRIVLAAEGRVSRIRVLRGLPDGLTQQAAAAACRIEFTPAIKDGRPVSQYVTLEYGFHLDNRPVFLPGRPQMRPYPRP